MTAPLILERLDLPVPARTRWLWRVAWPFAALARFVRDVIRSYPIA